MSDFYADLATELHAIADDLAVALVGEPGQTVQMSSGGSYHHRFNGRRGPVSIDGLQSVTPPEERALQEEIQRARAELERLRARLDAARTTSAAADDDGSEVTP